MSEAAATDVKNAICNSPQTYVHSCASNQFLSLPLIYHVFLKSEGAKTKDIIDMRGTRGSLTMLLCTDAWRALMKICWSRRSGTDEMENANKIFWRERGVRVVRMMEWNISSDSCMLVLLKHHFEYANKPQRLGSKYW